MYLNGLFKELVILGMQREYNFLTHPSYFPIELTVTWRGSVTLLESHNEWQAQFCDI